FCDRWTRSRCSGARRVAERAVAAGGDRGLLLYSSTGCADGVEGDLVMLGPPLVVSDAEGDELVELTATAREGAPPRPPGPARRPDGGGGGAGVGGGGGGGGRPPPPPPGNCGTMWPPGWDQ